VQTRQLGKDGPQLSVIGLGAWAIGGPWAYGWGPQDDAQSIRTIQAALANGINWIDTAAVYGLGHGEKVVGEAIKGRRNEVFVATKCGLVWDHHGRVARNNRPESIRRECDASLKRLQTDFIDLYQIHWPDDKVPVEDSWGEMTRLVEAGKVRYIGVSNFGTELLIRCQRIAPVQSLQPPYNLVNRDIEASILGWCINNGVGVIAYSPLQNGLLTGKFSANFLDTLADDDWRKRQQHPFFREPKFSQVLKFVDALRPIAEDYQKSLTQLAIAWVLQQKGITAAIVGARTPEQIIHNIGGAGWQISASDLQAIDRHYQQIFQSDAGEK
jgi:aryl-alcohol dehydrogenase-like predicted oxidoreductase